ncbi:MAG: rod shape-determining protein MreC [Actinobacteria bacterium]|nr:rod shape-determining protein MreC [Actinomycetota bacterium]
MNKLNTKKYIKFIAVIMLLIFLHFTKILAPVERVVVKTFNPVLSGLYSAGSYLRVAYNKQTDKRDLVGAVERLENEVRELITENTRLKVLEEENQILREYLKFSKENEADFVLGNVVVRRGLNADGLNQNIIIDKGSRDGVKSGAAVAVGGAIVGKVVGVKNNLSEICLITGEDCKLAVSIQNINKTSGIISGEMGLTIKMEFIPQTDEIKIGDTVITSGLEENIPRGLIMGKVAAVNKESNELWQSAVIEPLVDMDELIIVSVLIQ